MAIIIDGKAVSAKVRAEIAERVSALEKETGKRPGLAVVIVGEDPASKVYVRNKAKGCAEVGFYSEVHELPENTTEAELMALIDRLHAAGAEVLMSSHVCKYTPAERVMEIAMEHKRRGADISKIVTAANTVEEELENLRIANMLKERLGIPFLYLAGGENHTILRRLGGKLGACMSLCVVEHDECATKAQPLLSHMKKIRDELEF